MADSGHAAHSVPTVVDRLQRLILARLDVTLPADEISGSTPLFEGGLGLDSFAVVELITLVEKEFEFIFPETDLRPEVFADLATLASAIVANAARGERGS